MNTNNIGKWENITIIHKNRWLTLGISSVSWADGWLMSVYSLLLKIIVFFHSIVSIEGEKAVLRRIIEGKRATADGLSHQGYWILILCVRAICGGIYLTSDCGNVKSRSNLDWTNDWCNLADGTESSQRDDSAAPSWLILCKRGNCVLNGESVR